MGGMLTTDAARNLIVLCLLVAAMAVAAPTGGVSVCEREGCNCTTTHSWVVATCSFDTAQVVELGAGALPARLIELHLSGARELRLLPGAFSRLAALRLLRVSDVQRLLVRKHAFLDLSSVHLRVGVRDCAQAVLETHAFRGVQGPVSADISRCAHVVLQGEVFAWLLTLVVRGVARLELAPYAFAVERQADGHHGPVTTVLLQSVILAELPQYAFPSLAAEVRLEDAQVRTVRRDAFYAITLLAVTFRNTSLQRVETGAFSDRTLIHNLELSAVRIGVLAERALQAAVNNLTVQHSRVTEVASGAINITVAKVTFRNSVFEKVHSRSFEFKNWDCVLLDNNTFLELELGAFLLPFQPVPRVSSYEFSFTGNEIRGQLQPNALAFVWEAAALSKVEARVDATRLSEPCHCGLASALRPSAALLDTSLCAVDKVLARCLGLPQGWGGVRNYTELMCHGQSEVIMCERTAFEMTDQQDGDSEEAPDRERKVLALIFVAVVLSMIVILAVTAGLWLRRKGYCVRAQLLLLPTTASCLTMLSRLIGIGGRAASGTAPPRTVSNEYTELQQQQAQAAAGDHSDAEGDYEYAPSEDKWTQTLPEELTHELLQSLREKLDDPENYSEARDMIEHLYDLIKVEESCSNNNKPTDGDYDLDDGENVYDVIQSSSPTSRPRQNGSTKLKKSVCSVGTRAPSPDKLLPATTYAQVKERRRPPVVCEYVEPKDRQQHLYAEVPGVAGPPPQGTPAPTPARSPVTRPLSFLRALGESLLLVPPQPTPITARTPLCEYAEPTDAAVHVYSELPVASRMANRPLPTKPDQDPGEGTSS